MPTRITVAAEVTPLLSPDIQFPSNYGSNRGFFILPRSTAAGLVARDRILGAAYCVFLLCQLLGLFPYVTRIIDCCFLEKKVSFQCKRSTFPHSAELELAMLASMNINMALCLWFVRKIPRFLGYKKIFKKLSHLPAFWSLVVLLVVLLVGLGVINFSNEIFLMQSTLTFIIACQGILIAALVGVLNYTQVNPIRERYSLFVLVLFKATLVKIFVENFVFFLMGTLQLTFNVAGLAPDVSLRNRTTFQVLRHFSNVVYAYRVSDFLWQKIFVDNRNILSNHENLEASEIPLVTTAAASAEGQ